MKARLALALLLSVSAAAFAQAPTAPQPITVPNSAVHYFYSKINDSDNELFIILPRSYYTNPTKRYPVFYLLDGNDVATVAFIARARQHSDLGEIIFVGVGYPEPLAGPPIALPGKPAVPAAQRSADYALVNTTEPWSPPADRGAPVFLKVIQQEIIPYIDTQYRTIPTERAIGGHSLGGLFTTYALFHATDTFNKFWIGSPSLLWGHKQLFGDEEAYAKSNKDLKARVIATVGGQESKTFNRDPMFDLMNQAKSHHYPSLIYKTVVFPNEDHGAMPLAVMPQVLEYLYGPPYMEFSPEERANIAGDWRLPDGTTIHFGYEGDLLFATGLPMLSNTPPTKEQYITPLAKDKFMLRTLLYINEEKGGKLSIQKMEGEGKVVATRVK